jgi:hypothetical protein
MRASGRSNHLGVDLYDVDRRGLRRKGAPVFKEVLSNLSA